MLYHIIFNPTASNGKSRIQLDRFVERLQSAGAAYEIHETKGKGHAETIVRELGDEATDVVVVGGDGTLHEVLNGLYAPQETRLTVVPAGTGNDFAVAANIPFDAYRVAEMTLYGEPKETDYMETPNRRCMNVGGLGMDVEVLECCARGKLKGKIKYLLSLISCLFTFRGYRVRAEVNGEILERKALFAAVCNGSQIGGGIRICPNAKIDDGKAELVIVRQMSFFGIIRAFISLMRGKILTFKSTEHFYCDGVEIVPDEPRTVQLDGELYDGNHALKLGIRRGLKIYRE